MHFIADQGLARTELSVALLSLSTTNNNKSCSTSDVDSSLILVTTQIFAMVAYKVLVATVIINCLVKGTLKSLGVLMLELSSLGVSTQTAAWIPAIAYTLFAVMSTPVAK